MMPGSGGAKIWAVLGSRALVFVLLQVLIAAGFAVSGVEGPWGKSARYWTLIAAGANVITFLMLLALYQKEGLSYAREIFKFEKKTAVRDILVMTGLFVLIGPVAYLSNVLAAKAIFGSPEAVIPYLFGPMPLWAAYLQLAVFPATIVFAELPLYFGYCMPRLEKQYGPAAAFTAAAFFLAFQHCFLPFIPDLKYLAWRLVMFLPLAFAMALIYKIRPALLPYMMIGHGLIDISTAYMVLLGARGMLN